MSDTSGAPVLVFGGCSGIGGSLARMLADAGRAVVVTSRSADTARRFGEDIGGKGIACDVLEDGQIERCVRDAAGDGGLSGLAFCVGSIDLKPISRVSADDMLTAYRLNTVAAALAIQAAVKPLKAAGGSVVLFSTVAAQQGFANHAIIASAKGGVEALTLSLAAELSPDIRINCIAPSLTKTEIAEPLLSSAQMADAIAKMHALPRLGEPEDCARLADFLLSPQSSWMTGQIIGVDGGRSTLRTKG